MPKRTPKLKYGFDDDSILEAITTIIKSSDILPPKVSVDRIVKVIARRNASLGGQATFIKHGRQHYIDMVNARKDRTNVNKPK